MKRKHIVRGLAALCVAVGGFWIADRLTARTGTEAASRPQPAEGADGVETGLLGQRIPYIKSGSGPRKVVVFFGGNALFKRIDRHDARRYAGMIRDILPPDCTFWILGYREDPPPGYDLNAIVADAAGAIGAEIGKADVVGVSFGGFVSLRFAAEHPELVDKLVVLISAHRFSAEGEGKMANQFAYLKDGNFRGLLEENALLFRRPWYNLLVRLKLWKDGDRKWAEYHDPAVILRAYEGIFSGDFARNRAFAERIRAETLVVGGTRDQYFDVAAFEETARMIPSARLELFDGETHMLPVEKSGEVTALLNGFLNGK